MASIGTALARDSMEPREGHTMKKNRGQGLTEYLILLCLVAVAGIAIVSVLGQNIRAKYASISAAIRGDKNLDRKMVEDKEDQYRIRGMDDFIEGGRIGED